MPELTHFDESGASRMVDVGDKPVTARRARASGRVRLKAETLALVRNRELAKGDVLEVARLAGIMAAKRTGELIPLCHPLGLDSIELRFNFPDETTIAIEAEVRVTGRTGVEMEALTAVSVAGLTIYDMCKAVDRSMSIESVHLEEKSGGRSGHYAAAAVSGSLEEVAEPRPDRPCNWLGAFAVEISSPYGDIVAQVHLGELPQ